MPDLAYRQQKIQEKRKQTPFRDFVMEICSRKPLNIYNIDGILSRYPNTERKWNIVDDPLVSLDNDSLWEYTGNFFEDYIIFFKQSKKAALSMAYECENSKYSDTSLGTKNCYLSFNAQLNVENVLYSCFVKQNCSDVVNSAAVFLYSSVIFESKNIRQSSFIFYCVNIDNSSDLRFCCDMIGCHHCMDCECLVNKSYCINNQQFTKEEYQTKRDEILKQKSQFSKTKKNVLAKMWNLNSTNSTGKGIINSNNIENGYIVIDTQDARNIVVVNTGLIRETKKIYDILSSQDSTNIYACPDWWRSEYIYCCHRFGLSSNCYYCMNIDNCSFCLWCYGLQNKSYYIFNKEYSKEERYIKVDEIFTQMEKDWTLWQFFPAKMNPFYFNDTAAYLIDPSFTKEEVEKVGYLRRDEPIKVDIPADLEQVHVRDLDQYERYDENGKRHIDEEILKKVIVDEQGNVWRIVNMEYAFLMKYGLPLPRKHWLERMKENFRIG